MSRTDCPPAPRHPAVRPQAPAAYHAGALLFGEDGASSNPAVVSTRGCSDPEPPTEPRSWILLAPIQDAGNLRKRRRDTIFKSPLATRVKLFGSSPVQHTVS